MWTHFCHGNRRIGPTRIDRIGSRDFLSDRLLSVVAWSSPGRVMYHFRVSRVVRHDTKACIFQCCRGLLGCIWVGTWVFWGMHWGGLLCVDPLRISYKLTPDAGRRVQWIWRGA